VRVVGGERDRPLVPERLEQRREGESWQAAPRR